MKISSLPSTGMTVGNISAGDVAPTVEQKLRALKINTNATPGYEPPAEPPKTDPSLTIPDANSDVTSAATEENQPISPQLAELARRRRALQVKEREIADREKALETRAATDAGIDRAKFKSDPLGVMLEEGIGYDQLTQAVLARQEQGYNPKVQALEDRLKSVEQSFEQKLADREAQAEKAALAEMRGQAVEIASQGDEFQLVRETGSIPVVMRLIEKVYREKGKLLGVREALGLVETDLNNEALKLARLNKVQSQLTPTAPTPPQQTQRRMTTLTNRDTASVPLSRKARALAAWNGTLKK